jgi:hypothetical protein
LEAGGNVVPQPGSDKIVKIKGDWFDDYSVLFAAFSPIPGAPSGGSWAPAVMSIQFAPDGSVSLPLGELGRRMKPFSTFLSKKLRDEGLTVSPEEARIARVGTGFYVAPDKGALGAGLADADNKDPLMLMYFYRPCTMKGVVEKTEKDKKILFDFEVEVPSKGLHWLRIKNLDSSHSIVELDSGEEPVVYHIQLPIKPDPPSE